MPQRVLKEIFGFDSFRPGQEEVVRSVLDGRDTLAVIPTGGGKSLCYQVPALMKDSLTVIVSPLISLMKDQVDSLIQNEVQSAAALHSGLSPQERWDVERRVRDGEIKMLYVAPERLRSLEFVLSLRRSGVGLFVVDEAHCVSEWGHDFRPDYLFLPRVVRDLGGPPVLALTATATPRVRQDIVSSMRMRDPAIVVTSFDRPNLTYRVVEAQSKEGKLPAILDVIRRAEPPGIVYALSRKECEEIASGLRRYGIEAEAYHAGLPSEKRASVQERFMTDELPVVAATIAFGMGVDKPNVRFVIHATVPASLPAYIQESGRAGRDGAPSECVVIRRGADIGRRKRLISLGSSGDDVVAPLLRSLSNLERDGRVNATSSSIANLAGTESDTTGILLRGLEDSGAISRGYDLWDSVEVNRLGEDLGSSEDVRDDVRAVHSSLPGSGSVNLADLSRKAGVRPAVAQGAVFSMMADGTLDAVPRGSVVDLRLGGFDDSVRGKVAARLKRLNSAAFDQLRGIEEFISLESCRREYLLRHFGDESEVSPCGGCDVCLGESLVKSNGYEASGLQVAAFDPRLTGPPPDPELVAKLKEWRSEQARSQSVPAYVILHNSHIEEIAALKPTSVRQLGEVKGVGLRRAARYGEDLISLVKGEPPAATTNGTNRDYEPHIEAAREHLRAGRGAEAVPELALALKLGDEEAKQAVDELLRNLQDNT